MGNVSTSQKSRLQSAFEKATQFFDVDEMGSLIQDAELLDPSRDVRQSSVMIQRKMELAKRVSVLANAIRSANNLEGYKKNLLTHKSDVDKHYRANIGKILTKIRTVEATYRGIDMMFNARKTLGPDKNNVCFINATVDQLGNSAADGFRLIENVLTKKNYDPNDKTQSYALLVIPGYLAARDSAGKLIDAKDIINDFAHLASKYRIQIVTDYADELSAKDLMGNFGREKISGDVELKKRIIMFCNWVKARGAYIEYGESEGDLFIPPSLACLGPILANKWSQVTAGVKDGSLPGVHGLRLTLGRDEAESLRELGLIPLWADYGVYYPVSDYGVYTGGNLKFRCYSVVRTFDTIDKRFQHISGRYQFRNMTQPEKDALRREIETYMNALRGEYIRGWGWEEEGIHQEENKLDIKVWVLPYYPASDIGLYLFHGEEDNKDNSKKAFTNTLMNKN